MSATIYRRMWVLIAADEMASARAAKAKGRPAVVAHYVRQARHANRMARRWVG